MPLPTFKTQQEIPDAFRSEYEEKEGEWRPKSAPADGEALKEEGRKALKAERDKAKAEKDRADAIQVELDKLRTDKEAEAAGASVAKLQEIRDRELKPLQDAKKKLEDRVAELETTINFTKTVEDLAKKHNVMVEDEGRFDDFMSTLNRRTKRSPDGKSVIVLDKAGNETTQTLDELISKTLLEEKKHLYKSDTGSGGGGGPNTGGTGGAYDPVAEGKKMAAAQKRTAEEGSLALK